MARVKVEWSAAALADLDRFAAFLIDQHPRLAPIVASAILEKVELLAQFPELGRPDQARSEYRQIVLRVLNASYVSSIGTTGSGSLCLGSSTVAKTARAV